MSLQAPELSQKSLQRILDLGGATGRPKDQASLMRSMIGMTAHNASEQLMYSASVVERAVSVCNLLAQVIGQPMYFMT